MLKLSPQASQRVRIVTRILIAVLITLLTLAISELNRILNPQHYYYGYPMSPEDIGRLNNGLYCVALDPYNRECFSTEDEMMAFSEMRSDVKQALASMTANPASSNP
jgi:hypothetical protein